MLAICILYCMLFATHQPTDSWVIYYLLCWYRYYWLYTEPNTIVSNLTSLTVNERTSLLEISLDLEAIYLKATTRGNTVLSAAQNKIDLYYIYFIRLSEESIFKIDSDVNRLYNTNILLKQKKDILCISALRYIKQCLIRNKTNIYFCLLALIQDLNIQQ